MQFHIYCNQKNIDSLHQNAIKEFEKRLSAYCSISLHLSTVLSSELMKPNHHYIRVISASSTYSSEEFASYLHEIQLGGISVVHILIGYSETDCHEGLSPVIDNNALHPIAITKMQLSHKTQTLLLYEQIYRGYTILQGKTYHK